MFNDAESSIKYLFHASTSFGPRCPLDNLSSCTRSACVVMELQSHWTLVPGLLSGAVYGRIFGMLLKSCTQISWCMPILAPMHLWGLLRCLVASLAFASLTIILVESTGDVQLGVAMMATVLAARWPATSSTRLLYDIHIELNQILFCPGSRLSFSPF